MTLAILTGAFCLASTVHFLIRVVRNWRDGVRGSWVVSLSLAALTQGPLLVVTLTRTDVSRRVRDALGWGAFILAVGLVVAILSVEYYEDQAKRVREARRQARGFRQQPPE